MAQEVNQSERRLFKLTGIIYFLKGVSTMFHTKCIGMLKYFVSFLMIATLAACSDDGIVAPVFDPDVPPQNVQVVSGDSNSTDVQNTISWTRDPAATDYVIYVSNTPGVTDSSSKVAPTVSGSDFVTHSGTDVVAGTPFYYKVQALSGTQSSVLSDEVTGTPQLSIAANNLNDVAWNGTDTLVAVGDAGEIITSPNGLQDGWTSTAVAGVDESLSAVTWESTNSQFLIVGAGLTVLTWDGSNNPWLPQNLDGVAGITGNATDLEDVAWVDDLYVAVGKNSLIITSPDGSSLSWTIRNDGGLSDNTTLLGVASNGDGSKTVAVGTNGTLLTSDDKGLNWEPWTVTESNTLNDVTWDGSQFIVVGATGTIYTSTNGVDWERSTLISVDSAFIGVTQWDSSLPVDPIPAIVGATGDFIVVPDATTALFIRTGTTEQLSAVTWVDDGTDPAYFVIVGHDGFVLTSRLQ
jgi:photosystem II stability/assembly factor-like uncharacterized protein